MVWYRGLYSWLWMVFIMYGIVLCYHVFLVTPTCRCESGGETDTHQEEHHKHKAEKSLERRNKGETYSITNVSSATGAMINTVNVTKFNVTSTPATTTTTTTTTTTNVVTHSQFCSEINKHPLNDYHYHQRAQEPSKNNRTDYNIIILSPFRLDKYSTTAGMIGHFLRLMCSLSYPPERISIAIGLDHGDHVSENDLVQFRAAFDAAKSSFHDISIYRLNTPKGNWTKKTRHKKQYQLERRKYLAMARNNLLFRALGNAHDWVLWLDSDLDFIPPNLIQLLLSPNEKIVVPSGVMGGPHKAYDLNTWRETNASLKFIADQKSKHGDNFLMLEGYGDDHRLRLETLRTEGNVVQIHGVGGMAILVDASCHRNGLVFPTFVLDSHIETEGLAKMATKMGIRIVGLPLVNVFHKVE